VHTVQEIAELAGVDFGGAVLRPHAILMKEDGDLTRLGEEILSVVRIAGYDLANHVARYPQVLDRISQPLISAQELQQRHNRAL
jgi:hypothetical protein